MTQIQVTYTQDAVNCSSDRINSNFKGDLRVLAKHIDDAYSKAGVEVLMISKVEEVEIGLL